jgi:hypothetical protein
MIAFKLATTSTAMFLLRLRPHRQHAAEFINVGGWCVGEKGAATKHSGTDLVLFKDSNFPKAKTSNGT